MSPVVPRIPKRIVEQHCKAMVAGQMKPQSFTRGANNLNYWAQFWFTHKVGGSELRNRT